MMLNYSVAELRRHLANDGMSLVWLPANEAFVVTFGDRYDSPILKGPAPFAAIVEWWLDLEAEEASNQEPCYD